MFFSEDDFDKLDRDLGIVELFAGCAAMSAAFDAFNVPVFSYDIKYSPEHDFTTVAGFALAIVLALRVAVNGVLWMGPKCSTWVWMALSHTKRALANDWQGNDEREDVRKANLTNRRVQFLIALAQWRRLVWCVEQPGRTCFFKPEKMMAVLTNVQAARVWLWLGAYGHDMLKPTVVFCARWGAPGIFKAIERKKPQKQEKPQTWRTNGKWVTAALGPSLSESEHYPSEFCQAFAASYMTWVRKWGYTHVFRPEPTLKQHLAIDAYSMSPLLKKHKQDLKDEDAMVLAMQQSTADPLHMGDGQWQNVLAELEEVLGPAAKRQKTTVDDGKAILLVMLMGTDCPNEKTPTRAKVVGDNSDPEDELSDEAFQAMLLQAHGDGKLDKEHRMLAHVCNYTHTRTDARPYTCIDAQLLNVLALTNFAQVS